MSRHLISFVIFAIASTQGAGAQQLNGTTNSGQDPPPGATRGQQTDALAAGLGNTRVTSGVVESVDADKRRVLVKQANGGTAMIVMGPNVHNFKNLRQGDRVTIKSSEALALAIAKKEEGETGEIRQRVEANATRQDPPGSKPGLMSMERSTLVANVYQIDRDAGTVTLRGIDGIPVELRVQDVQALQGIGIDDQVVVSYIQATVFSVDAEPRSTQ